MLCFAGHRVVDLIREHGTPSYFYGEGRIRENVARLRAALGTLEIPVRLFYAMKANRQAPVLKLMKELGVGVDICSPGELQWARDCGFNDSDLSFTAGSLSTADYAALAAAPLVWVNADSLTAIQRLADVSPGREIGLRINPSVGLGYGNNDLVRYSGDKPTKFGVYWDRFSEALSLARRKGVRLTGLHCHAGCGFLTPQLPALDEVFSRINRFLDAAPDIRRLNLGGGLGIPLTAADQELDLSAWVGMIRKHFSHRKNLGLEFEPGDYLVKDAGLLALEVTQVEEKCGRIFVGVNAGFNVHPEPAFYRLPLEPVPALLRTGEAVPVTLVGNINEALDVWAEEVLMPPLFPGDSLCLLNAGGYGASMSSHHCLRYEMKEHFLSSASPGNPRESLSMTPSLTELNESNKQAWDRLYASIPGLVWGRDPLPFLDQFRDDFRQTLRSPSRLLEAGAGEGRNLPFLLSCDAEETHAADASLHGLTKIPSETSARLQVRCTDIGATGFPDAHFDGITLLDVIETLPDSTTVLREMFRILKPGGLLLCNIPGMDDGVAGIDMRKIGSSSFLYQKNYYYEFHSREEARTLLQNEGLEIIRSLRCEWEESAHPGFREDTHRHVSLVFLARRPSDAPKMPSTR
jgi:diaminopimelate decarboxylase